MIEYKKYKKIFHMSIEGKNLISFEYFRWKIIFDKKLIRVLKVKVWIFDKKCEVQILSEHWKWKFE